jgi:glycosyltransferase involved in cell wall biosynthesis
VHRTFGGVTPTGLRFVVASAARRADALLTGTVAARDQICATLGLNPAQFVVVHHGHQPARPVTPTSADTIRARYELAHKRVVLCVAAKRPHKNQELLVRAAAELEPDTVIVLAGHPEPYDTRLRALACELGSDELVRFVDYVSDEDLEGLWNVADCAAFPTLGEGFGIPVIEAMAHGLPVAASDIAVLREVGGELVHYFDPHEPSAAAHAIRKALSDTEAGARGRAHAARFSWEAAAHGTFEAYERGMSTHNN